MNQKSSYCTTPAASKLLKILIEATQVASPVQHRVLYNSRRFLWILADFRRIVHHIFSALDFVFCKFCHVPSHPRKNGKRRRVAYELSNFHTWGRSKEPYLAKVRYPSTPSRHVTLSPVLPVSGNSLPQNSFIYLNRKGSDQHRQAFIINAQLDEPIDQSLRKQALQG